MHTRTIIQWVCGFALTTRVACAQEDDGKPRLKLEVLRGPTNVVLGSVAQLDLPQGYAFLDGNNTRAMLKASGEPVDGSELGFIRAGDILSRPLLELFHPLAVAKVFCPRPEFEHLARVIWREPCYPSLPLCPSEVPAAHAAESHARAALRQAIERLLREAGLDPAKLLPAPVPTDASSRSYCPRCEAQFTLATGVCADCGGQVLIPFAAARSEAAANAAG